MADKRKAPRLGKTLGLTGLNFTTGLVSEDILHEMQFPNAARIYQEMSSNDPVIASILYLCETKMREATWSVAAAGTTDEDKKAAEFLQQCMDDMENTWEDFIAEALSVLVYGFSFHETIYKVRGGFKTKSKKYHSKYDDYKIGWRSLAPRAQSTLARWDFDDEGNAIAFVQSAAPDYTYRTIPLKKGLLFRTQVHKNNPEGKSPLRGAYTAWYTKKNLEIIEAIGIERDLNGLPVLTAAEGVDLWDDSDENMREQLAAAEAIVSGIKQDAQAGVVLPPGWKLELLSASGSTSQDTNKIINRYNYNIAAVLLADIVMLGSDGGSNALAEVKEELLSSSLESQLQSICAVLNKDAVPTLFAMNGWFPENGFPKIESSHVNKATLKEVALLLRTANLDINHDLEFHNYVRNTVGLTSMDEKDFKEIYGNRADAKHNVGHASNSEPSNVDATGKPISTDDSADKALEGDTHYV